MSLFKVRDCWSTVCGQGETFSCDALTVFNLFGCTNGDHEVEQDNVILGSLDGVLRVYNGGLSCRSKVNNCFSPSDLLVEVQTDSPILQVCTGKLVSCSQKNYIAVLRPFSVLVCGINQISGSTDHGDQYVMETIYEHKFECSAYQMVIGPFGGGISKRDFICILSLDGTMLVYEQQAIGFRTNLPLFLHPFPIKYVQSIDAFVTLNSDLCLACYKYQELADPNLKQKWPTWSCNLGEIVYDIQTMTMTPSFTTIHVLGERHYYCFQGNGVLWFIKRLQYSPCCFYPYVLGKHPEARMMCMIVSDNDAVMVYEQIKLKWSAKLPYRPCVIARASSKELQGCLVLLSEFGDLRLCYLGTEPAIFMPPEKSAGVFKDTKKKLAQLKEDFQNISTEDETDTLPRLKLTARAIGVHAAVTGKQKCCDIEVDLLPSLTTNSVQVVFLLIAPLTVSPSVIHLNDLTENTTIRTKVFRDENNVASVASSIEFTVCVYYSRDNEVPGSVQQTIRLPLPLVYDVCPFPSMELDCSVRLSVEESPVSLKTMFKEFFGESTSEKDLCLCTGAYTKYVRVIRSSSKNTYEVLSSSLVYSTPVVEEILFRHREYYKNKTCKIRCDASEMPVEAFYRLIEEHIDLKKKLCFIQEEIASLCSQYRIIQKCIFNKLKENTEESVSGLSVLIDDAHETLMVKMAEVVGMRQDVKAKRSEVRSVARLLVSMLGLCSKNDRVLDQFKEIVACSAEDLEWEEKVFQSLSHLLGDEVPALDGVQNDNPAYLATSLKKVIDNFIKRVISVDHESVSKPIRENSRGTVSPILESEEGFYA
ncbi:protein PTHB1 isoform X2 [Adelges cooleyi]|nr:protein PTHB1 isoform X2 [Adelges cooleyi]